jgi:hypothetical protein
MCTGLWPAFFGECFVVPASVGKRDRPSKTTMRRGMGNSRTFTTTCFLSLSSSSRRDRLVFFPNTTIQPTASFKVRPFSHFLSLSFRFILCD